MLGALSSTIDEGLGQRLVGSGGNPETKSHDHSGGLYGTQKRESFVPAQVVRSADASVTGKPSMSAALGVPNRHRQSLQSLVGMFAELHHLCQIHGHLFELVGMEAHEAFELRALWQSRERFPQMILGVTVEVSLAGEPRLSAEDGEGEDLATR